MPVTIRGERVTVPPPPEGQRRRLVWPNVEGIYRSLAKHTGVSFATDEAVRAMAWQDTGHVFGERSVARARRREAKRGTITCKRIKPNRIAGTVRTYAGTVRVRFPDEAEKRAARWREKVAQRKRRRELADAKQKQKRPRTTQRSAPELVAAPAPAEPIVTLRDITSVADVLASLRHRPPSAANAPPSTALVDHQAEVKRQIAALRELGLEGAKDLDKGRPPNDDGT